MTFPDERGAAAPPPILTPAEFVRLWARPDLVRLPPDTAAGLRLSEADRAFLVQAGLPRRAEPGLAFAPARLPVAATPSGLRVLGTRGAGQVCLDETREGRVVYLEARCEPVPFNSGVRALAASLLAFRERMAPVHAREAEALARLGQAITARAAAAGGKVGVTELPAPEQVARARQDEDDAMRALLTGLRDDLRAIDADAMSDAAAFWPVTLAGLAEINGLEWDR